MTTEGFEEFYRAHLRELVHVAVLCGGPSSWAEAEDTVHTALIDLMRRWHDIESPLAYCKMAVRNQAIKDGIRRRRILERHSPHPLEDAGVRDHDLDRYQYEEWLKQILDRLPERQRQVFLMVHVGVPRPEIAASLGVSLAAVRSNLRYANRNAQRIVEELQGPQAEGREETR
jgi:RNA polymerase sigma factor (sigma-70 family)